MNLNDLSLKMKDTLSPHLVMGSCLALAFLTLSTLGYNLYQWHQDWLLAHDTVVTAPILATKDDTANLRSSLPNLHLFGNSANKLGNMPITNLQLSVTGIAKVDTEQSGSVSKAYISIAGQPSKIFQLGDKLPYGVKVYDITPNAVVLENDGHLEKLLLPREGLQFKPKQSLESPQYD